MNWRSLVMLALVAALMLVSVAYLIQPESQDPLAKYRTPEGQLRFSGESEDDFFAFWNLAQGPKPTFERTYWVPQDSRHPTVAWTSYTFVERNPNVVFSRPVPPAFPFKPYDLIESVANTLLDWLFPRASAAAIDATFDEFNVVAGSTTAITRTVGFQAEVIFVWMSGATSSADAVDNVDARRGFGFAISTTDEFAICTFDDDGAGTMATNHAQRNDAIACSISTADAIDGLMNVTAIGATTVDFTPQDAFPSTYHMSVLFLGGTLLTNADVGTFNEPAATGDFNVVTSPAFQPEAVFFMTTGLDGFPAIAVDSWMSMGFAAMGLGGGANPEDYVFLGGNEDAATSAQTMVYNTTGASLAMGDGAIPVSPTSADINYEHEVDAWNVDGFSLNVIERTGTTRDIIYLAIDGLGIKVGSILMSSTLDTDIVTSSALGFQPSAVMILSGVNLDDAAGTPRNGNDEWSLGAFTSDTDKGAQGVGTQDGNTNSLSGAIVRVNSAVYAHHTTVATPAVDGLGDCQASSPVCVGPNNFGLNQDDADPTNGFQIGYIAFAACGTNRYWVGGTGSWTDTSHWSETSGGTSGCPVPTSGSVVFADAASCTGVCTITVDVNASVRTFDSTGFDDTGSILDIGTFDFDMTCFSCGTDTTIFDNILVTMGTSSGNGLDGNGAMRVGITNGAAVSCGTAACNAFSLSVNISSSNSYIDFGSGTWRIADFWTNSSTSSSWDAGTGTIIFQDTNTATMIFAGSNLAEAEFNNVTFGTSPGVGDAVLTMSTRGLRWLGTLTVADDTGTMTLVTSDLPLGDAADTPALVIGNGGTLTANASTVSITDFTMTGGTSGTLTLTTGSWTLAGSWNSSGAGSTFTQGTSTVTMNGAGTTITLLSTDNDFNNLTISAAGTVTLASDMDVLGTLTVNSGAVLALATFIVVITTLAASMAGGISAGASGSKTIQSDVSIAAAGHFIFGGAPWTYNGTWTNNTTSASWDAGTGTVTFDDATAGTMTFAGSNLSEAEFSNVTFSSTDGTAQTFTMATRGIRWLSTLTISDSASTTTLATGDLAVGAAADTGDLTIGNGGILTANASTVIVSNVTMTGGTSGTITVTTGTWTVGNDWNTSGTGSTYTQGTGIVTFDGSTDGTGTITMLSTDNTFDDLTVSGGTITLATTIVVTNTCMVSGGTFDAANLNIQANSFQVTAGTFATGTGNLVSFRTFNVDGTMTMDSQTVNNMFIDRTAGTGFMTITTWTAWAVGCAGAVDVRWTQDASVAGDTWQFVLEDVCASTSYDLIRASIIVDTQISVSTTVTLSEAAGWASGQTMQIDEAVTCGSSRFWVGGTGSWSDTARWSDSSGGASGCGVPTSSNPVTIDAASCTAACTITVDVNAAMASFTNSGFNDASSTMAIGTFNFAVSGSITLTTSNMAVTIGISAGTGMTATTTLALSGGGNVQCGTSACVGDIDGAVTIDATSYIDFGSATWNFGGAWTNNTTSASWDAGTGTAIFDSTSSQTMTFAGTNLSEDEFSSVTFQSANAASQTFTMATRGLRWGGTLTVQDATGGTILDKGTQTLTGGAFTLAGAAGGALLSTSGDVTVTTVSVSTAASYIDLGSESWSVSGTWTNSTTSASWDAGTGTVNFTSATGGTTTFAGANLSEAEFNNAVFESSAGTAQTFTMSTRGLRVASTLTIQDSSSTTRLDTSGSNLAITAPTVTLTSAGGELKLNGSTGTVTSINTVGGLLIVDTSTIVVDTSGGTVSVDETLNNLTVNSGISTTIGASLTWSGTLTVSGATLAFGTSSLTSSGAAAYTSNGSTTVTMSTGSWDTDSVAALTFSGSYTFSGTGSISIGASSSFGTLEVSGGTRTQLSQLTATTLTISGGTLGKGTQTLTVNGNLTMSGGDLTSTSGAGVVTGNVNISSASSAIDFGSESWTVSGSWTNGSTDSTVWDKGTGAITFDSASNQTTTFAGTNLSEDEFFNTFFSSTSSSAVVFSMATRGLRIGGELRITDSVSTTELDTNSLAVQAGPNTPTAAVTIASSGILTADDSVITVFGNWSAVGTFNYGTSEVKMSTAGSTIDPIFFDLTIDASTTLAEDLTVLNQLTVNALLNTADFTMTLNLVTISAAGAITLGTDSHSVSGTWTNGSTSASWDKGTGTATFTAIAGATMTFAGSNLSEDEFNHITFNSTGATAQTFTMSTRGLRWGGTLTIADTIAGTTELATSDLSLTGGDISIGNAGILTANASTVSADDVTMTGGTSGTLTLTTGSWTLTGSWNSSGAGSTFTQGSSTVTMSGTGTTITLLSTDNDFNNLTISASGTVTLASDMDVLGTLTVNSGAVLALATFVVVITTLAALSGGITAGASGSKTVQSAATINSTGYFGFGGAPWTFNQEWTNNTTNALWDAGSGAVTFDDATAGTMTFAGSNLSEAEFNNLTFNSTAGTAQTFTMATRSLRIAGVLTVTDSSSTTTLLTSNLNLQASIVDCLSGGLIDIGTGDFLTLTTFNIDGQLTMDGISVANMFISRTGGTGTFDITAWTAWTAGADVDVRWTFSPSVAGDTLQFVLEDVSLATIYSLIRNGVTIEIDASVSTVVTFNHAGGWGTGDLMAINETGGAGDRYLVLNDAVCTNSTIGTDTDCWSVSSGGPGGASVPTAGNNVIMDVLSGDAPDVGTLDATMNITTGTYNSTGFLATFAIATFTFSNTGTFLHASGTITLSTGSLDVGSATVSSGITATGAGSLLFDGLTVSASTIAKGDATLTVDGTLTMSGGDITSVSGVATINGSVNISSALSAIDFGSETWTVSGSWTNSSTDSTVWDAGTGTMTFTSATGAIMTFAGVNLVEAEFNHVTFQSSSVGPQTFTMSTRGLNWSGTLTVTSDTVLDKATFTLGAQASGALSVGGTGSNALVSTSGDVTVTTVTVSGASDYIDLGSENWTVSGTWTNSTTSSSWDAGTGTITFTSATGGTMTFAGSNLPEAEFNSVTFTSSAGTPQTFTMSTRGLRWLTTLSVTDSGSTTTLATSDLSLGNASDTPNLSIGNAGILTANASTVTVVDVTMTGGASGTITLTTGSWTVGGNWNTSGVGSVFAAGTSTVTMNGTSKTVSILNSSNGFDTLNVSGTISQSSLLAARILTVSASSSLTKTGFSTVFKQLTVTATGATVVDGAITVSGFASDTSEAAARTTISTFTIWTVGTQYEWTHTSSSGTTTITFTINGNAATTDFRVRKNGASFQFGVTNGSGQIIFSMLGSDPTMLVQMGPFADRYLVLGAAGCTASTISTDTDCWSFDSGGLGGAAIPSTTNNVLCDSNSGGGTGTMNGALSVLSWNMTGFVGTVDTGGFALTVSGTLTVQSVLVTSTSTVTIGGSVTILTAPSYITNSIDGLWTVGGNWTNASTSASWSFNAHLTLNGSSTQSIGGTGSKNIFGVVTVSGGTKSFTSNFTTSSFGSITATTVQIAATTVTWTIRAASTISGSPSGLLTLRSSIDGVQWNLVSQDVALGVSANYVDVKDSNASGGGAIDGTACTNVNSGNNTNWLFGSCVTGGGGMVTPTNGSGRFVASYPDSSSLDWLIPRPGSCLTVHVQDMKFGEVYHWDWGDGTTTRTTEGSATHTYPSEGQWTIIVTVFGSRTDGVSSTQAYFLEVSTVDGTCFMPSLSGFLFLLALVGMIAIGIVWLATLGLARKRKGDRIRRLRRRLALTFFVGLLAALVLSYLAGLWRA